MPHATALLRRQPITNANIACWCNHPASTGDTNGTRHVCTTELREVVLSDARYIDELPGVSATQVLGADAPSIYLSHGATGQETAMTVPEARRLIAALEATITEVAAHGRRRRRRSDDGANS